MNLSSDPFQVLMKGGVGFSSVAFLPGGVQIPLIGLGTAFKAGGRPEEFMRALKAALLDADYRHIDAAWYYKTESMIGEVLDDLFLKKKLDRRNLFITSKVWPCFWNDPEISLNHSLHDLRIDYLDLYIQHWPACFAKVDDEFGRVAVPTDSRKNAVIDPSGDYLVTYRKLLDIKNSTGKIKAVGVSNYSIPMLQRLMDETGTIPAVNQVELHPYLPQLELAEFCKSNGIIVEAYSPLGSLGAPILKIPLIKEMAASYNVMPVDIIINYLLKREIVCLPRSSNAERIKKGFTFIDLKDADVEKINNLGVKSPKRYIDKIWAYWND